MAWFELRLVSAGGKPLSDVPAVRSERQDRREEDGRRRRDPLRRTAAAPAPNADWRDCSHPAVVFPDILEEWSEAPEGKFGKNRGSRDDHRKCDGMVFFVPAMKARTEVKLANLTEEQKLQHLIRPATTTPTPGNTPKRISAGTGGRARSATSTSISFSATGSTTGSPSRRPVALRPCPSCRSSAQRYTSSAEFVTGYSGSRPSAPTASPAAVVLLGHQLTMVSGSGHASNFLPEVKLCSTIPGP